MPETFIAESAGVQADLGRQLFLQIDGSQVSLPESFELLKHTGRINEARLFGGLFDVVVNGHKGEREVRRFIGIKGFAQQREGLHDGLRLLVDGRPCTCLVDAQEPLPGSRWRLFRGDAIGFGIKALSFTGGGAFSLVIALMRHGRSGKCAEPSPGGGIALQCREFLRRLVGLGREGRRGGEKLFRKDPEAGV